MKFISPKIHGFIDLLLVVFLLASPWYFGFTGAIAIFTYVLAGVHLLLTLVTDYSVGLFKVLPGAVHGAIEFIVGVTLVILAYTAFSDNINGKLYYVVFGTAVLLTWLLTDYTGIHTEANN